MKWDINEYGVLFGVTKINGRDTELPEGVTESNGIISVMLPDSIKHISCDAFSEFNNFHKITIPPSVEEIYSGAFSKIPENFDLGAFSRCLSLEEAIIMSSPAQRSWIMWDNLFVGCKALKKVTLPDEMDYIGNCMFKDCSALENIQLPRNLREIGDMAFYNCSSLTDIILPQNNGNVFIEKKAFQHCSCLESVVFPKKHCIFIRTDAFKDCPKLSDIQIDLERNRIGINVFDDAFVESNPKLKTYFDKIIEAGQCGDDVYWKLNNRGELTISGSGPMYDYHYRSEPIFEKATAGGSCTSLYSDDEFVICGWKNVGDLPPWSSHSGSILKLKIEEGVTYIGSQAFTNAFDDVYDVESKEIYIPNSVKKLEIMLFRYRLLNMLKRLNKFYCIY